MLPIPTTTTPPPRSMPMVSHHDYLILQPRATTDTITTTTTRAKDQGAHSFPYLAVALANNSICMRGTLESSARLAASRTASRGCWTSLNSSSCCSTTLPNSSPWSSCNAWFAAVVNDDDDGDGRKGWADMGCNNHSTTAMAYNNCHASKAISLPVSWSLSMCQAHGICHEGPFVGLESVQPAPLHQQIGLHHCHGLVRTGSVSWTCPETLVPW